MSRRRLLGLVAGALGATVGADRARAGEASTQAACYWRHAASDCYGGTAYEYWCYRCCDLTGCDDAYCEWRVVGTC